METAKIIELQTRLEETPDNPELLLELANNYIAEKEYSEALPLLERAYELGPNHPALATNIGAVAIQLDDAEKALKYFQQAVDLAPKSVDSLHNLGLLYTSLDELEKARGIFERIIEIDPENAQAHGDLAVILGYCKENEKAKAHFQKSLELSPFFERGLRNYLEFCLNTRDFKAGFEAADNHLRLNPIDQETARWRSRFESLLSNPEQARDIDKMAGELHSGSEIQPLKIVGINNRAGNGHHVFNYLARRHDVKLFRGKTIDEMRRVMNWAELAIFEGCDQYLMEASYLPGFSKIICRMNEHDIFSSFTQSVEWSRVECLIMPSEQISRVFRELNPAIKVPHEIIHAGIDTSKFRLDPDRPWGKSVCALENTVFRQDPGLLLQCFKALQDIDSEFRFFLAGAWHDPRVGQYIQSMAKKINLAIEFDDYPEDLTQYFKDKDFVISTSTFESIHESTAQGMACGLVPLVHDWPGADEVYPQRFRFRTPQECAAIARSYADQDRHAVARDCRTHVMKNLSLNNSLFKIEHLAVNTVKSPKSNSQAECCHGLIPSGTDKTEESFGRVSVVIPLETDNVALVETLQSLGNQNYADLEVVLTLQDDTQPPHIDQELGFEMKIVESGRESYLSALNQAIEACNGKYIAFMKPGDITIPESIHRMAKYLNSNSECGMVYGDYYLVDENWNIADRGRMAAPQPSMLGEVLFHNNPIKFSTVMVPRSAIGRAGGFADVCSIPIKRIFECALWHKIASLYKVAFMHTPLVYIKADRDEIADHEEYYANWKEYQEHISRWQPDEHKESDKHEKEAPEEQEFKSFRLTP